jgi:hypothetical protein
MHASHREGRGWLRAAALLAFTAGFSVLQPGVLVAVPFVLLAFILPPHRIMALLLASAVGYLVFRGSGQPGVWFIERGWALLLGGWFVALTLRWPGSGFASRALGALGGALAVTASILAVRPGEWAVVRWLVDSRIRQGLGSALEALRLMQGDGEVSEALANAAYRTADIQSAVFPALLGLTSLSALGVAWWLYVRLARGSDQGVGPLRDFRFNDQLMWVVIAGLGALLLGSSEAWSEAGTNALVFMGALYALRGAAVVVFLYGGLNLLGMIVFVFGLLFVAPIVVMAAMVIGIGDTWLDLRSRATPRAEGGS